MTNTENTGFTPEQIQKAKDFIWEYMEQHNRELLVGMATLSTHERHGLYVKKVIAYLEADGKTGRISDEKLVIGFQYNHATSPLDNN